MAIVCISENKRTQSLTVTTKEITTDTKYYLITQNFTNNSFILATRNSSGDEIANVNFLYDDIVHAVKIQWTLA